VICQFPPADLFSYPPEKGLQHKVVVCRSFLELEHRLLAALQQLLAWVLKMAGPLLLQPATAVCTVAKLPLIQQHHPSQLVLFKSEHHIARVALPALSLCQ
jgi:hypothetical protein